MDTIPILGTAMWGWTMEESTCFALLDEFYARGHRMVDAATNYPINKRPLDFRAAENILLEWINANGISDLKVMMKVGSVNNLRTPEVILNKSFLLLSFDEYKAKFDQNLDTIMVHWDNRSNIEEIEDTFDFFDIIQESGIHLGLSGIKHPDLYAKINVDYQIDFTIQMKHNLLQSDYKRYQLFHGKKQFLAYGMNAGGVKLDDQYNEQSSLKSRGWDGSTFPIIPKLQELLKHYNKNHARNFTAFFEVGLLYAMYHDEIKGVLIGTSKLGQLKKTLDLMEELAQEDYGTLYRLLLELSRTYAQ